MSKIKTSNTERKYTMNFRKNHILSLMIVAALTSLGVSASETFAVAIPVNTKVKLTHPALPGPIVLSGTANIDVTGTTVDPGVFHMTGPHSSTVIIDWHPSTVDSTGRFRTRGQARAKFIDPATGSAVYISFYVKTKGRTNSVAKAMGKFRDYWTSTLGSHLRRGKYHH
jgi:hypothetical protein